MDESESRWRVYRATFDTNIFLRALIRRGSLADNLLSLWLDGRIVLVLSHLNLGLRLLILKLLWREYRRRRYERAAYLRQIHPF